MRKTLFIILLFTSFSLSKEIKISYIKGYEDILIPSELTKLTAPLPIKWDYSKKNKVPLFQGHRDMCIRKPNSVMCKNQPTTTLEVSNQHIFKLAQKMYFNFKYIKDYNIYKFHDFWNHNDTVHEKLIGDCEDICMTFISQLIKDGVSSDRIRLVLKGDEEGVLVHSYVQIFLWDGSIYKFFDWNSPGITDEIFVQLDNIHHYFSINN